MSSSSTTNTADQFGPNEWLVEEMYQRFLDDPAPSTRPGTSSSPTTAPRGRGPTSGRRCADRRATPRPPRLGPLTPHRRSPADRRCAASPPRTPTPRSPSPPSPRADAATDAGRGRARATASRRQARGGHHVAGRRTPRPRSPPRRAADGRGHHPARRGVRRGQEHERLAHRAHGHERARRACQAARRQPGRHQQPAQPHPRRQDQLHAPDRLRRGQGAGRLPGDEPALRRGGRQADRGAARAREPRAGDRPARARTASARSSSCRSRAARR